jgi:hypothetical protein
VVHRYVTAPHNRHFAESAMANNAGPNPPRNYNFC